MKGKDKRKAKVAKPKSRAVPKAERVAPSTAPSAEGLSYERALAKSVLDHDLPLEGEDAATLSAAVSSLTSSLKRLSYNYGMTVGRSVYKLFEERERYRWYGDSIQDLVLFFEKLGYSYILYKILTDNVEIMVHRKSKIDLGCSLHSFDAGVMAGFLGAARGDFVRVFEVSCCNNGAEACKFTTAGSPGDPFTTDINALSLILKAPASEGKVRPEYQMLGTEPLMKADYAGQINAIFFSLGQTAALRVPEGKITAKALQHAAIEMERFGLGTLDYSAKPLKMEIQLAGVKAKKEFVDISISFLNGMIGRHFSNPLKSQLARGKKGSYRIIVKQ